MGTLVPIERSISERHLLIMDLTKRLFLITSKCFVWVARLAARPPTSMSSVRVAESCCHTVRCDASNL